MQRLEVSGAVRHIYIYIYIYMSLGGKGLTGPENSVTKVRHFYQFSAYICNVLPSGAADQRRLWPPCS
jgi:hypothetical protein